MRGLAIGALTVAVLTAACGDDRDPPSARDIRSIALSSAVDIRAIGCKPEPVRGSGSSLEGGYILTAAHVVAGADTITVRAANEPDAAEATILAFDPVNDLALLSAPDLALPAIEPATVPAGEDGVTVLFRDGEAVVTPLRVDKPVIVHILDIFHEHEIDRPSYVITIDIDPGDSGAVVVTSHGTAAGVLYATSRATEDRSFATDASAIPNLVAAAAANDGRPAESLRCVG